MAKGSSLKLSELKLKCLALDLNPTPTRNRVNKDTGERYKDFSKDDYMKALQEYYISKYKLDGTYHHSLDWILKMDSPMLALQIKNSKLAHTQTQQSKLPLDQQAVIK